MPACDWYFSSFDGETVVGLFGARPSGCVHGLRRRPCPPHAAPHARRGPARDPGRLADADVRRRVRDHGCGRGVRAAPADPARHAGPVRRRCGRAAGRDDGRDAGAGRAARHPGRPHRRAPAPGPGRCAGGRRLRRPRDGDVVRRTARGPPHARGRLRDRVDGGAGPARDLAPADAGDRPAAGRRRRGRPGGPGVRRRAGRRARHPRAVRGAGRARGARGRRADRRPRGEDAAQRAAAACATPSPSPAASDPCGWPS